jgi:hypothetical protein
LEKRPLQFLQQKPHMKHEMEDYVKGVKAIAVLY